jgi:AraC family transcriptional regulator, transcriptional activator FtrA
MRKDPAKKRPPQVAVVVVEGVTTFELAVACEIFGSDPGVVVPHWYRLILCSPTATPVKAEFGLQIEASHRLAALREAETIVVPPLHRSEPASPEVLQMLREAHRRGARILSLCTGAFTLAAAGLLDGRRATTHWRLAARLARQFPRVEVDPDVLYIDEGDVLTSAGSAASIDLCLHVVRKDFGAGVAAAVARGMVVPPHRPGGQAQFIETPLPGVTESEPFAETLEWVQSHLSDMLTVEMLADRAAMSPRTFARRFRGVVGATPHHWITSQRVSLAQRLLETTELSIDVIADRSGFGSAANFRQHFARTVRTTPNAYRSTFHLSTAS